MKQVMKTVILAVFILSIIPSSSSADIWSKMFKVKTVGNNPQDLYEYGLQVGYNDYINGQNNYLPSLDPFVQGYYAGRRQAITEERIRFYDDYRINYEKNRLYERRENDRYQQPRVIIIDSNNYNNQDIYYDH